MSKVYYYCDGEVKKSTTINMTERSSQFRFFNTNDGQITEEYKVLTFTASVAPTTLLKIKYSYDFRMSIQGGAYSSWQTLYGYAYLPAGQTSITKEVMIQWEECFDSGYY